MAINRTSQTWPADHYHELPEPTVTLPARMLNDQNELMNTLSDILNCGLVSMSVEAKRRK